MHIRDLTVRDFYAAEALRAIVQTARPGSPESYAALAWDLADAMFVERVKRTPVPPRARRKESTAGA